MRSVLLALGVVLMLAGCAAESVWSTDDEVARAAYRHDGPPRLTLYTMINNRTGSGAHSALMINGAQRVMFDPAGSFNSLRTLPERNDVLYGITPHVADVYTRYHARETFHVRIQRLDVTPEMADRAMALAKAAGPVPNAACSLATSRILAQLFPGEVSTSWFPVKTADAFARILGVTEETLYEYDSDDNSKVLANWDPARARAN
ncbi:hypothetical protein [Roseovarius autotrophicus]|uniref:hypothetical protein n=1 Tax=Roseovarius autotrophicus TaxID=2824121 RepID=UPI001B3729D2|nr:hypothetical protein [Roseovarius autotrophicus]